MADHSPPGEVKSSTKETRERTMDPKIIIITVGYALSFAIGATKTSRMQAWNTFFAIGMTLFVIGLMIRIHSLLTLKQYFTYSVAKVENHKFIETGLYKFIRHPGYLGQLIIFLGISTSISNWASIGSAKTTPPATLSCLCVMH